MKKSAYFSDLFFTFCVVFLVAIFIFRHFKLPLPISVILSAVLGLAGAYLLSLRLRKKQKIFALKKSEEEEKNSLFFYLCLLSEKARKKFLQIRLPFLLKMLNGEENDAAEMKDTEEKAQDEENFLRLGKYFFVPIFRFREITPDDVAEIYPFFEKEGSPVLLCDKLSESGKALCEKLSVQYLDGALLYKAFKDGDSLPNEYPIKTATPLKRKRRNICFSKSNSRRFLVCAAMLFISATFIPFPVYYITVGIICLTLSVLLRIFGYR